MAQQLIAIGNRTSFCLFVIDLDRISVLDKISIVSKQQHVKTTAFRLIKSFTNIQTHTTHKDSCRGITQIMHLNKNNEMFKTESYL